MNKQNLFPTKWSMAIFIAMVVLAGSVFAVGQTERVVYRFHGGNDGADPDGGLISDQAGNFYGAVRGGGAHDYGAIFQMSPPAGQGGHWTESVIYNFTGGNDGGVPTGELIFDQAGNLYGVALLGGSTGGGTVFELTPQGGTWTESVIYNFQSNDQPVPGVVFDKAGNLYGATAAGGGHGSVFQLAPSAGWRLDGNHDLLLRSRPQRQNPALWSGHQPCGQLVRPASIRQHGCLRRGLPT